MTIAISFVVIGIWSLYRLLVPENILFEDIIAKPVIWLLPVFLSTRFRNLGFVSHKVFINIILGFVIGLVFATSNALASGRHFTFSIIPIISALLTAVTEETFFRGYLLNRWLKSRYPYLFVMLANGLLFTLSHVPVAIFVYHYSGVGLLSYLLSNFITGFVYVYLFYSTGSVYAPISSHFVWNLFAGMFK